MQYQNVVYLNRTEAENVNLETTLEHIHDLAVNARMLFSDATENTKQLHFEEILRHTQAILDNSLLGFSEPQKASWFAVEESLKYNLEELEEYQDEPKLGNDEYYSLIFNILSDCKVLEAGICYWMHEDLNN